MEGGSEPQLLPPFPEDPLDPLDPRENSKIVDFADRRGALKPRTLPKIKEVAKIYEGATFFRI